ncbi:MAG: SPOR domain-containing protein [Burkholderiaceae bacterium]
MAFLKSRKESPDTPAGNASAETVESLRRRARQRLIGAAVLVVIGVVGFPLLFDTQPRPVPVDIPIEIPDRNKAKGTPVNQAEPQVTITPPPDGKPAEPAAAAVAEPAAAPAPATSAASAGSSAPAAVSEGLGPREEVVASGPAKPASARAEPGKPEAKAEAKADNKTDVKADDGTRAKALLEGKADPAKDAADAQPARFVVQVGAYAEADKAREVRQQLERAGLKTYTHIAETKDGKRIRVRIGPFPTRAEADRVSQKVKDLGLPVAVLTL